MHSSPLHGTTRRHTKFNSSPSTTMYDLKYLTGECAGRRIVLIPGMGNNAHVFDDFAPKLASVTACTASTTRGFEVSSQPASGYQADRLGDDVLAVLEAL